MTPPDMNVKIAEILGLKYQVRDDGYVLVEYDGINTKYTKIHDYTTDKALCWDLIDMLGEAGWRYSKVDGTHCWVLYSPDESMVLKYSENESLLLATCAAFLEEFGK